MALLALLELHEIMHAALQVAGSLKHERHVAAVTVVAATLMLAVGGTWSSRQLDFSRAPKTSQLKLALAWDAETWLRNSGLRLFREENSSGRILLSRLRHDSRRQLLAAPGTSLMVWQ